VVFVEGALPGELVTAKVHRRKNNWEQASLVEVHRESAQRVRPRCPHFGLHEGACGGCKMQHLHVGAQVAIKQRVLEDNLWHLAKVKSETMLPAIQGPDWGYRWRARFSVRHVRKKEAVLVGFHERKSRYVADTRECHVVPRHVSDLLLPLRALIGSMDAIETCPQIELACGDTVTALVLRHLEPLSPGDLAKLRAFAGREHAGRAVVAAAQGPATPVQPARRGRRRSSPTRCRSSASRCRYGRPTSRRSNRTSTGAGERACGCWTAAAERVIDWFCGLGNFTLPLATAGGRGAGHRGSEALVARSRENYARNHEPAAPRARSRRPASKRPQPVRADARSSWWPTATPTAGWSTRRAKAPIALAKALADLHQDHALREGGWTPPRRIVYVSCNPATLARDAGLLVHQAGYRCTAAGVVNMFPHTAHVESIAVFEH
jgi:23S rRNA (uracil1939-C5)-methyltransferase